MNDEDKKYSKLIKDLNNLQQVKAPASFEADLKRKLNSEKFNEKKQSIWSKFFIPSRLIPSAGFAAAAILVFIIVSTLNPEEMEDPLQMEPRVREDIIEVVDYDEVKLGREDKKDKNEAPLEKRTTVTEAPVKEEKLSGRRMEEERIEESFGDDEMVADFDSAITEPLLTETSEPTTVTTEGAIETEMATGLAISKEKLNFRQIQLSKEEQQVVDQLRQKVQIQATDSLRIE